MSAIPERFILEDLAALPAKAWAKALNPINLLSG